MCTLFLPCHGSVSAVCTVFTVVSAFPCVYVYISIATMMSFFYLYVSVYVWFFRHCRCFRSFSLSSSVCQSKFVHCFGMSFQWCRPLAHSYAKHIKLHVIEKKENTVQSNVTLHKTLHPTRIQRIREPTTTTTATLK